MKIAGKHEEQKNKIALWKKVQCHQLRNTLNNFIALEDSKADL